MSLGLEAAGISSQNVDSWVWQKVTSCNQVLTKGALDFPQCMATLRFASSSSMACSFRVLGGVSFMKSSIPNNGVGSPDIPSISPIVLNMATQYVAMGGQSQATCRKVVGVALHTGN